MASTDKKTKKVLKFDDLAEQVESEIPQTVDYDTYRQLEMELEKALSEIDSLKQLLSKVNVSGLALPVSDEEEIASIQIARLKNISKERQLTLEEVRIFDYLVKNKRLSKEDSTEIIATNELPKNLDKKQLIQIAKVKNVEKN